MHVWERQQNCRLNPQLNACYADEDFIRTICGVAFWQKPYLLVLLYQCALFQVAGFYLQLRIYFRHPDVARRQLARLP